jgi:hypothetical protein
MIMTSQEQLTKDTRAKVAQAVPDVKNRMRGFAGNHLCMMKRSASATFEQRADEGTSQPRRNEERAQFLQRQAANGGTKLSSVMPIFDEALLSPGQPLEATTRRTMESRMGQDFNAVRVHTDARSAAAAAAIDARAYTMNRDIVFGAHEYAPQTESGRRLLAHELTHVVQQRSGAHLPGGIGPPNDAHERNADAVANELAQGRSSEELLGGYKGIAGLVKRGVSGAATAVPTKAGASTIQRTPSLKKQANALARELKRLIDGATWKEIRKRVYPKESAPGIKRAKERRAGKLPDLTGLGSIKTLDHFAAAVSGIRTKWAKLLPDDRVKELGKAADVELASADVPGFLIKDKKPMEFKAFFQPSDWKFVISEELVTDNSLSSKDASLLTNTTLHESRHAEQNFLAARFAAGVNNSTAAAIVLDQDIPKIIADAAVAKKFDATTDAKVADLGKQMFQAFVTDAASNQAINADTGMSELNTKRAEAQTALDNLTASATALTIADATAKRDALRDAIAHREQRYTAYRKLPFEADSHEVGDAAELAFTRRK